MSRKIFFIVLLLLAGSNIRAQRDFRNGYVVTNQHDTIYGWIDYRGDIRNAKICSFKETENGEATDYTPSDIAAYRFIDSKFYISKNIGNADVPKLVFLEYLVNGLASLYYYREDPKNELYYIEKDGQFVELKMDEKEVTMDGRTQIKTMKSYVGVLKATLNVWEMNSHIDRARLEHASLINIARDYHQFACTDGSECIIYEKKKPAIALRIAPVAGVDVSSFRMMDKYEQKFRFDPSSNITVGVNLNFSMPRQNEKFFLQLQAMYTKYSYSDVYEKMQDERTKIVFERHVTSNVLHTGLMLKYEYPKGKWRPTFSAGTAGIWLPDGWVEETTDVFFLNSDLILPSSNSYDLPGKFLYGFGAIPGIHYYMTQERIIFIQLQYLQCYTRVFPNCPPNIIRSFGLSAGVYF